MADKEKKNSGNGLIFKNAEKAKSAIIESQQKEIRDLYEKWADEIGEKAKYYSHKSNASAPVSERYYKELQKQLRQTSHEVSNEIYKKIKSNMYTISDAVIKDNVEWLSSFGFSKEGLNAAFSYVPNDVVQRLVTGQIYESGWSLSSRIWGDNERTLKDIYQVMARGVSEQKPIYEIAKDLEAYVRPSARLPWNLRMNDGKKIYKKQVDYNAQRLARTLTQHSYQQSFIAATEKNPFVKEYVWISNGSRVCDLCKQRDGMHFKKGELPMDHPNGMCTMEPVVDNEEMKNQLVDWFNSQDGTYPEIDEFASNFGYIYDKSDMPKIVQESKILESDKVKETTQQVIEKFNSQEWMDMLDEQYVGLLGGWCEDWLDNISLDEKKGVVSYTGKAYRDMNEYLRGMKSTTRYKKDIENCTLALEKASLPKDTITLRGSDYNVLEELGIDITKANKDKLVGGIIQDKGFLSTSPISGSGFTGEINYIIKVPKGSQAMYVAPISKHPREKELLINRGGKYMIEDIRFDADGNVYEIYMTLKNLKNSL